MEDIMINERFYTIPSTNHLALDCSFSGGDSSGPSLPHQSFLEPVEGIEEFESQMTQLYGADDTFTWPDAASTDSTRGTGSSQSDKVVKSPATGSFHCSGLNPNNEGSCLSSSPTGTSHILTPSTLSEYPDRGAYDDLDLDNNPSSPRSGVANSLMDDFVQDSDGDMGGNRARGPIYQPPLTTVPRPQPGHSLPRSRGLTAQPLSPQSAQGHYWNPDSTNSTSTTMNTAFVSYDDPSDRNHFSNDHFAHNVRRTIQPPELDMSFQHNHPFGHLPYRTQSNVNPASNMYSNPMLVSQQQIYRHHPSGSFEQTSTQQFGNLMPLSLEHQFQASMNTPNLGYNMYQPNSEPLSTWAQQLLQQRQGSFNAVAHSVGLIPDSTTVHSQSSLQQRPRQQRISVSSTSPLHERSLAIKRQVSSNTSRGMQDALSSTASVARRPLQKAESAVVGSARIQTHRGVRKGGRSRGGHLDEPARAKSNAMRKVGACWRCVLQRDSCDDGVTCNRCQLQAQKGQLYFFPCDRSKLPDFVYDFLPPSMTIMHQKQTIEDTVSEQVQSWDCDNSIDVYLSSGYGPPLVWRLYEFEPKTHELLTQMQFILDPQTGLSQGRAKYSPPFGLLKIDMSDDAHFESYLETLLEPENLLDFGWSFYEEESQIDCDMFQAQLLDYMCTLYLSTTDMPLRMLLKDILRMTIITFIMGHTLTIVQDTLSTVISHVRKSSRPPQLQKHTSPRLANRQLKFFFAVLRNNIYEKMLKWQQGTLHTAGKKEQTWLQAFCVMLGFAMVLEEVQRTIQIQGETSAVKGEMSVEGAEAQARNACERIDQRFGLLVGLFQCKYRDKKWTSNGSFGPQTPELKEDAQVEFCRNVRELVEQRYEHLESRQNVTFSFEAQPLYTTRLTARFLLPFLNLPG